MGISSSDQKDALTWMRSRLRDIGRQVTAGSQLASGRRASLYKALAVARRMDLKLRHSPAHEAAFRRLCKEKGIRKAKRGANKLTRLVKLCFGAQPAVTINRYANVLGQAHRKGWAARALERHLHERGLDAIATMRAPAQSERTKNRAAVAKRRLGTLKVRAPTLPERGWGLFLARWTDAGLIVHCRVPGPKTRLAIFFRRAARQ